MRPSRSVTRHLVPALGAGMLLTACAGAADDGTIAAAEGETQEAPAGDLQVVATTSILGDIATELLGDEGEVQVLLGPGVDPHGYQPSARDGAQLREADLVVANGLQLEESLLDTLAAAAEDGVEVFELAPRLDPIAFEEDADDHEGDDDHDGGDDHAHDEADDHDGHEHGPEDPHVWFDPVRMVDGVEQLAAALIDAGADADAVEGRAEAYVDELAAIHEELDAAFAAIDAEERVMVTNHDSLGYLADRYDIEVVGTVVPGASTQVEADAASFAELVRTVEERGITTVFAENTDSTTLAEQLASESVDAEGVQLEVVRIATDALDEPGSDADSYLGLLRSTGTRIADALRG